MASKREIVEQGTEVKRLTEAMRNLRESQLKSIDAEETKRLGAAFRWMREQVGLSTIELAKAKEQYAALGAIGKALADLRNSTLAGKAGMAAGGVAAAGKLPGQAIEALGTAALRTVGAFERLGSSLGRLVEASNPGEMLRFRVAIADLSAAFGRVFEPVITMATQFANVLNQFITSLQPVIGPVVRQLADAFLQIATAVLDAVAPIVESLMPIIQLLADVVLPPIVTVFRVLADAIRSVINWIRSWLGLDPLAQASTRGGGRTVAAQRATQIGTEQIGEQARASAFGAATTVQVMQRNNDLTARSNELLQRIVDGVTQTVRDVSASARASRAAIAGLAG